MRRFSLFLLLLLFFIASSVTSSLAGYRHYGSGYGYHYYSRSPWHHLHHYDHSYYTHYFWGDVGIGFLTGAVIGSVLSQPPKQPAIIYQSAPPIIYYQPPVGVYQRYSQTTHPLQVLRRVKTTPELLNFRSAPDLNAEIYGQLSRYTMLDVLGAAPGWLYIRTETGQYGWIMTKYTEEVQGPVG